MEYFILGLLSGVTAVFAFVFLTRGRRTLTGEAEHESRDEGEAERLRQYLNFISYDGTERGQRGLDQK